MTGAHPEKGRFAGDSAPWLRGDAMDDDLPLEMGHAEMDAAVQAANAIQLNLAGGWLMRYRRRLVGAVRDRVAPTHPRGNCGRHRPRRRPPRRSR